MIQDRDRRFVRLCFRPTAPGYLPVDALGQIRQDFTQQLHPCLLVRLDGPFDIRVGPDQFAG